MYWTVWLALGLFAIGELGKRAQSPRRAEPRWAWRCSALGVLLMLTHIMLAMALRHGWSHAAAMAATARQTQAVFGLDWGGGVYVNYLFVAAWTAELVVWRLAPARHASRGPALTWLLRAFYLIVIANAGIVFAVGWRRMAGAAIVALLLMAWRPRS